MDAIEASIGRLREEIAQCEAQLRDLRVDLGKAELEKRNLGSIVAVDEGGIQGLGVHAAEPAGTFGSKWPLDSTEYKRYGRQLILPEVGLSGQLRLRSSRVLIIGAGGLGCPAAAYLAGAGVGTLGLVDGDTVEESNLHRQILHSTPKVGMKKVHSAIDFLRALNPHVKYVAHDDHLRAETAQDIIANYDIVLDCTDNPASRYLISDACILLSKPLVSASALKTDGQLMAFNYPPRPPGDTDGGPCYRCMFPRPPPPESVVTCGEGGILGPIVGVMGVLQALKAISIITAGDVDVGTPQALLFSATSDVLFRSFKMCRRRKTCVACSAQATIKPEALRSGSLDYVQFCGALNPVSILAPEQRVSATEYNDTMKPLRGGDAQVPEHHLIDTREPVQFRLAHIRGSINIPFSVLAPLQHGPKHHASPVGTDESERDSERTKWAQAATGEKIGLLLDHMRQAPDTPIFTVCRLGNDSQVAVTILKEQLKPDDGTERKGAIKDIVGGLASWRRDVEPDFPNY